MAVALCEQRAGGASVARVWASIIACGLAIGSGQPATTSGVAMYIAGSAVPACRRRPGRRNTGLRTAATPAGVAEMSASTIRLRWWGGRFAARCDATLVCAAAQWSIVWVGDGNWACSERRLGGKGIQGLCAPMAERCGGAMHLRLRRRRKKIPRQPMPEDSVI